MTTTLQWTGAQQRDNVMKAIAALRSGDYLQGRMALMKTDSAGGACKWCVTGLLAEVARLECPELGHWIWPSIPDGYAFWHSDADAGADGLFWESSVMIPASVRNFYGLREEGLGDLVSYNDEVQFTFGEFADLLASELTDHDTPSGSSDLFAFNDG